MGLSNQEQDIVSNKGQDWEPMQLIDHVVRSEICEKGSLQAIIVAAAFKNRLHSAQGPAESLGAQSIVSYNSRCMAPKRLG